MMNIRSFLLTLATLAFHGCSNPESFRERMSKTLVGGNPKPISLDELQSLTSGNSVKARSLSVSFGALETHGKPAAIPVVVVRPGQKARVEVIREFRYPSAFEFPITDAAKGAMTPTTPTEFSVQNPGILIEFTPTLRGAFVVIQGVVTERVFEGFTQNAGDVFRPITTRNGILISPNRVQTPMFTTRETPFFAALQPGKTESLMVNAERGPRRVTMNCTVLR